MEIHPFDAATAVRRSGPHCWEAPLDSNWFGGRGPHGGHLAAQLLRAMESEAGDPRLKPRTLTVHFVSRAEPGVLEIATSVERAGQGLSSLSARALQAGRLVALALAALGPDRDGPDLHESEMPQMSSPEHLRGPSERALSVGPPVMQHYDSRFAIGRPLSGEPARAGGWIRLLKPRRADHLLTTALTDLWRRAVYMRLHLPIRSTTLELTVNYLADPDGLPDDTWFLTVFEAPAAHAGFFREEGGIWSADGRLLARSSQLGLFLPGA